MPRPLIPPRGTFVPASLIYHRDIPPVVFHTWVQLRSLAWGQNETPSISLAQLAELTGKSQTSLYGHMAFLRKWGALRWRPSGTGTLIVSFPPESEAIAPALAGASFPDSKNPEKLDPSFSADQILDSEDLRREGEIQDSRNPEKSDPFLSTDPIRDFEDLRGEGEKQDSRNLEKPQPSRATHQPANAAGLQGASAFQGGEMPGFSQGKGASCLTGPGEAAVDQYRQWTGMIPNATQIHLISSQIVDLELWQFTLEHWLAHGWNPRNIAGLLAVYHSGGPDACRICHRQVLSGEPLKGSTEQTLQQMLKDYSYDG